MCAAVADSRPALLRACDGNAAIHDRGQLEIPLGGANRVAIGRMMTELPYGVCNMMAVVNSGALPLVISPLPPLFVLLMKGCGCAKCEKLFIEDVNVKRGWTSTHDLMTFYLNVIQILAYAPNALNVRLQATVRHLKAATSNLALFQLGFIKYHAICGLRDEEETAPDDVVQLWEQLDRQMRIDSVAQSTGEETVPIPLLHLVRDYAGPLGADLTLAMLGSLEYQIWICMTRNHAPAGSAPTGLTRSDIVTPASSVQPVGTIPDADKWIAEASRTQQSFALRVSYTGDPDGCTLSNYPTVKIPSKEMLQGLSQNPPPGLYAPIDATVYSVLAIYFGALQIAAGAKPAESPVKPPKAEVAEAAGKN